MKIAILTHFSEWPPADSRTHCIEAQAMMLARHGHDVTIHCGMESEELVWDLPFSAKMVPCFPSRLSKHASVREIPPGQRLWNDWAFYEYDILFTHDFIISDWLLPFAESLRLDRTEKPYFHFIHSTPCEKRDWWDLNRYGPNHTLIYLNETDVDAAAAQFNTDRRRVRVIPNINDLRIINDFSKETWEIIDKLPGLMQAEYVQVYPLAADRMECKGLTGLIYLFAQLKKRGQAVCLLIVDGWTGMRPKGDKEEYRKIAHRNGLGPDSFAFTSDFSEDYDRGVPKRTVMELSQCGNLFVFPTRGEASPLVLPEAILQGGVLPVLNKALPQLKEVTGGEGLAFDFTAWSKAPKANDFNCAARAIVAAASNDICMKARSWVRMNLNMDTIYKRYYEPLLAEVEGECQS